MSVPPCEYAPVPPLRRGAWRALIDFWTRPVRAESLALFRILIGGTLLLNALVTFLPHLGDYLGPDGLMPVEAMDPWLQRTHRVSVFRGPVGIPFLQDALPKEAAQAWANWCNTFGGGATLFFLWLASLMAMTLGWRTRWTTILAWLLTVSLHNRVSWVLNGGDAVYRNALFYLMFAPAGAAWSLDSLRRTLRAYRDPAEGFDRHTGRAEPEPAMIPPWSPRLLQIHLCFIYVFTGLSKVVNEDWYGGDAVYWSLQDLALGRFPYSAVPIPLWLCRMASWITLAFEIGFPLLVVVGRLRPWVLFVGIGLHLGMLVVYEIGWFSVVMVIWYLTFLSGEGVARFFERLCVRLNPKPWRVFYDTFCPLCRRAKRLLESLDLGRRLEFRDIHDRAAMEAEAPGVPYGQALREMIVVSPTGAITAGFDGFRAITRVMPAFWLVRPFLYLPGAAWAGRRVYRWVAKRRFRLVKCDDGVCSLHLQALSKPDIDEAEIAAVVQRARRAAEARG